MTISATVQLRVGETGVVRTSNVRRRYTNFGRGGRPSIRQVAMADLAVGCAYTLLVIASQDWPQSRLGIVLCHWLRFTARGVATLLFFLPKPMRPLSEDLITRVELYRHVVVVCALICAACILASRSQWAVWRRDFSRRTQLLHLSFDRRRERAVAGYRAAMIGIVAICYLLLLGEPRSPSAFEFLYGNWMLFFRAPLQCAVICYLACHAVALRSLLPERDEE